MKNVKAKVQKIQILSSRAVHSVAVILLIHHIWLDGFMIKISEDIELNPGPKQKQDQSLSICHANLDSTSAHSFQKLALLQGYISSNKVDILCLSETFFKSDISCDDSNLQLPGFDLIRADHPSNTKRGGLCIDSSNIEACHCITRRNEGVIVKISRRKDCQQVLSVKKNHQKLKMEDIGLTGDNKVFVNSLCLYYRVLSIWEARSKFFNLSLESK